MNPPFDDHADLSVQVLALLREHADGYSEYQLIQQLRSRHSTHIPNLPLSDHLVLFRTHFLLFNALYRLREQLWRERLGHLRISPLLIRLLPYEEGTQALDQADPLRDYYLDPRHLRETGADDVARLLTSFWTRMQGAEEKIAALELLGLSDDEQALDLARIKHRYRQLVGRHHPDRGGSTERLQSLNLAMEILQRHYS